MENLKNYLHNLNPFTYFLTRNVKILMVGLDGSGKTTILYRLIQNEIVTTLPTCGFNVDTIHHKNTRFTCWDVGGSPLLQSLYKHYYPQTQGLIFVLDGSTPERILEAKSQLKIILDGIQTECPQQFLQIPILIWNNKTDHPNCLTDEEVRQEFVSNFYHHNQNWTVQSVSAIHGNGLKEGLDWLDGKQDPNLWKKEFWTKLSCLACNLLQNIPKFFGKIVTLPIQMYGGVKRKYFLNQMEIVMLGLDAPGKTSILYKLKLNKTIRTISTIGFNVETIQYRNVEMTFWDVGGGDKIRPLWRHYAGNKSAVIFVVDSLDVERMGEAGWELLRILNDEQDFAKAIFLIFANKQDLKGALDVNEIVAKLGLPTTTKQNLEDESQRWHVQPCSAVTGEGLYEGLDWLVRQRNYFNDKK